MDYVSSARNSPRFLPPPSCRLWRSFAIVIYLHLLAGVVRCRWAVGGERVRHVRRSSEAAAVDRLFRPTMRRGFRLLAKRSTGGGL